MASTRTDYIAGQHKPALLGTQPVKTENRITLVGNPTVASDVVQALKIPAGAFVTRVGVLAITAEGGTLTATVGDGAGAASWKDAVDLNDLTGGAHSGPMYTNDLDSGTDAYGEGKYYGSADTIDLTMSANVGDTAVFTVWAEMRIMERTA